MEPLSSFSGTFLVCRKDNGIALCECVVCIVFVVVVLFVCFCFFPSKTLIFSDWAVS